MTTMTTHAEIRLLLHCARLCLGTSQPQQVAEVVQRAALDWEALLALATRHNTMPLLYRGLAAACPDALPRATWHHLRHQYHINAHYNRERTAELLTILRLFAAHDLTVIPYKGPMLALALYDDVAQRQFGDLDLLLPYRHIAPARDLLLAQGYHPDEHSRYIRECVLVQEERQVWVELHWQVVAHQRLLYSFQLAPEQIAARAASITLDGVRIAVPCPHDMLLILCAHASSHIWDQFQYLCDIARLVQRTPALDWAALLEHAASLGSRRIVLLSLAMARELLAITLPQRVIAQMHADPSVAVLALQAIERLFDSRGFRFNKRLLAEHDGPVGLFASEGALLHIKTRERRREQLAYLGDYIRFHLAVATTLNEYDRRMLPLPAALAPLYYPLRLLRLLRLYGWHLVWQPVQGVGTLWRS